MTKQERAELYRAFLAEEGYVPRIDGDGDVAFKFEGGSYVIIVDEKDDQFFRLVFPGFWSIESDEERARVEKAALEATAQTKVAKVFPVRDDTWATIELFCTPVEAFKPVFKRSIAALKSAVDTFRRRMHEARP